MKIKTIDLAYGALLIALGVLLPQIFHIIGGQTVGATFLPMHFPVIIAGFLLGPVWGIIIGVIVPLLSFMLTGMPPIFPVPILVFMLFELPAYGFFAGLLKRVFKYNFYIDLYLSLVLSLILGRAFNALAIYIMSLFFNIKVMAIPFVVTGTIIGIPGIILQIVFVPPIIFAVIKGGKAYGAARASKSTAK